MTRWLTAAGVALPGLLLAGFGLLHPVFLAPSTAMVWWQLHVPLILLFPLLAVVLWVLLRGENGVTAWLARVAAYAYACFYTALDVLSGIGAGLVTDVQQGGSQAVLELFALGDRLGHVGVWCLVAASALAGLVLIRRDGMRAVPGTLVLVAAGYPFFVGHIFAPVGVMAMLGFALGCGLLAAASRPASAPRADRPAPVPQPAT